MLVLAGTGFTRLSFGGRLSGRRIQSVVQLAAKRCESLFCFVVFLFIETKLIGRRSSLRWRRPRVCASSV